MLLCAVAGQQPKARAQLVTAPLGSKERKDLDVTCGASTGPQCCRGSPGSVRAASE
jgi:hypothetical protein